MNTTMTDRSDAHRTPLLHDLWVRYQANRGMHEREQLIVAYTPLVKYTARRMAMTLPSHIQESDLLSYAFEGLIAAIERFDISRAIKFETYALTRVRGAILDGLRSQDWAPRSLRARAREVEQANLRLEHRLKRAPTEAELANELAIDEKDLQGILLEVANSTIVALDELWTVSDESGDHVSLLDTLEDTSSPDPATMVDAGDIHDQLMEALRKLPERERLIVALYYYENLTLREIGEVLGVTESRVSQLHARAVLRMKGYLNDC